MCRLARTATSMAVRTRPRARSRASPAPRRHRECSGRCERHRAKTASTRSCPREPAARRSHPARSASLPAHRNRMPVLRSRRHPRAGARQTSARRRARESRPCGWTGSSASLRSAAGHLAGRACRDCRARRVGRASGRPPQSGFPYSAARVRPRPACDKADSCSDRSWSLRSPRSRRRPDPRRRRGPLRTYAARWQRSAWRCARVSRPRAVALRADDQPGPHRTPRADQRSSSGDDQFVDRW